TSLPYRRTHSRPRSDFPICSPFTTATTESCVTFGGAFAPAPRTMGASLAAPLAEPVPEFVRGGAAGPATGRAGVPAAGPAAGREVAGAAPFAVDLMGA